MFEHMIHGVNGHIKIRDKNTGECLVNKSNAIHFGNISWAISQALAGSDAGHVTYMVFGSGGTSVDSAGNIAYRSPNTSNLQDPTAEMYQPTYWKEFGTGGATITVVQSTSNFSDLTFTVPLTFGEPAGQDAQDGAIVTNDTFVFDEIALYTGTLGAFPGEFNVLDNGRMLTHVIFHPVQKANNRELEFEYTIRVQMGP